MAQNFKYHADIWELIKEEKDGTESKQDMDSSNEMNPSVFSSASHLENTKLSPLT